MKIYTAEFIGVWLGGVALVFARDKTHAHRLLAATLTEHKLMENQTSLPELTLRGHAAPGTPSEAVILWNGDY